MCLKDNQPRISSLLHAFRVSPEESFADVRRNGGVGRGCPGPLPPTPHPPLRVWSGMWSPQRDKCVHSMGAITRGGVEGNEKADQKEAKGAKAVQRKTVTDIWAALGPQEMPDSYDTDSWGGGGISRRQ